MRKLETAGEIMEGVAAYLSDHLPWLETHYPTEADAISDCLELYDDLEGDFNAEQATAFMALAGAVIGMRYTAFLDGELEF